MDALAAGVSLVPLAGEIAVGSSAQIALLVAPVVVAGPARPAGTAHLSDGAIIDVDG